MDWASLTPPTPGLKSQTPWNTISATHFCADIHCSGSREILWNSKELWEWITTAEVLETSHKSIIPGVNRISRLVSYIFYFCGFLWSWNLFLFETSLPLSLSSFLNIRSLPIIPLFCSIFQPSLPWHAFQRPIVLRPSCKHCYSWSFVSHSVGKTQLYRDWEAFLKILFHSQSCRRVRHKRSKTQRHSIRSQIISWL